MVALSQHTAYPCSNSIFFQNFSFDFCLFMPIENHQSWKSCFLIFLFLLGMFLRVLGWASSHSSTSLRGNPLLSDPWPACLFFGLSGGWCGCRNPQPHPSRRRHSSCPSSSAPLSFPCSWHWNLGGICWIGSTPPYFSSTTCYSPQVFTLKS